MRPNLPIGYADFRKVIENKLSFVDKSLFIKEILDDIDTEAIIITRPRRFGKTLNLSMLHHFLAEEVGKKPTKHLFDGLKILSAGAAYLAHQGQYPVIFITLKDVRDHSHEMAYRNFCKQMSYVYFQHRIVLESPRLSARQKQVYESIMEERANVADMQSSLFNLTHVLYLHYGVKPWLLMDEYDTPIQMAYVQNYYSEMIGFMRSLLGQALKDNPYLQKAVITGILRISKESIFSGINNIEVYSLLRSEYGSQFGFTEEEVADLLQNFNLQTQSEEIKNWYNGYRMGDITVYNPWSIANCIKRRGELAPYWVNTSDNLLIRDMVIRSTGNFKMEFEKLLQGKPIERFIDEYMVFGDLNANESAAWNLLLMAGYLKVNQQRRDLQGNWCILDIPNIEVRSLYRQIIERWLAGGHSVEWYNAFLNHLLNGNLIAFERELKQVMEHIVSSHDVSRDPEVFYHGLMVGLTASLYQSEIYEIYSNRESGYGRYDYMIFSRDINKPTLLLEFKRIEKPKDPAQLDAQLEKAAQEGLQQIVQKKYLTEVQQRGRTNILKMGIAFCGKHFKIVYEKHLTN